MTDLPDVFQATLKQIADDEPQRHDLFIGLVGPLGSSRDGVRTEMADKLRSYGYLLKRIHLASYLDQTRPPGADLPVAGSPDYYQARMDAGDRVREAAGDWSGLAALAVSAVASDRRTRLEQAGERAAEPTAYIFDSLKHPREAALLRSVYGSAFWLLSIVQDIAERTSNLAEELASTVSKFQAVPEAEALALITRDEADPDAPHGQHVRDVFAEADFFLPVQRGEPWQKKLDRFFQGLFGSPFISPSADEEAMRHARAAALRSAAVGRQVGAVIVPSAGAPYLIGTNEVPKPGGGQYREGDRPDHRDFQSGADPNPAYTRRVIAEVMDRLAKAKYFTDDRNEAGGAAVLREATTKDANGKSVLDGARARSLIEFTRCLHAEQAAIVDAARTGTAIAGARLYTTTFPCHECTKFIIGSGIVEVQYIEPYPKSLASDLYRDLIDTKPPIETTEARSDGALVKVPFRPFLGFGPTRYDEIFAAPERRAANDKVVVPVPASSFPVGTGWSELAVRSRESTIAVAIGEIVVSLQATPLHVSTSTDTSPKADSVPGTDSSPSDEDAADGRAG